MEPKVDFLREKFTLCAKILLLDCQDAMVLYDIAYQVTSSSKPASIDAPPPKPSPQSTEQEKKTGNSSKTTAINQALRRVLEIGPNEYV